jgi:type II secretory pathway pseudopilin PulG
MRGSSSLCIVARGGERGVSLVEATVVMAVFALLAAVLAPSVGGYIDAARQTRAREDVQVIATAMRDFMADNAELQFLIDGTGAVSGGVIGPPGRGDGNRINLLVSDGDIPELSAAAAADTLWTTAINFTTVDTFSNHLIENTADEIAANRYRNPRDVTTTGNGLGVDFARPSSGGFNAPYAWRGSYLRGPVDPDPWGNRYAANVVFLDPAVGVAVAGIPGVAVADYPRMDVFVASAGPDEEVDTRIAQDGAVPGDDDFIFVVSSHAK